MKNPFRRLRELTRTSQKNFAAEHNFSKTTMTYIEQGTYPNLSVYMVNAIADECEAQGIDAKQVLADEYNGLSLMDAYHAWQTGERIQVAYQFRLVSPTTGTTLPPLSPFDMYIKDTAGSVQSFCKLLKVPAATVSRYSSGVTKSMPLSLREALVEIQYPYMDEMVAMMTQWQNR